MTAKVVIPTTKRVPLKRQCSLTLGLQIELNFVPAYISEKRQAYLVLVKQPHKHLKSM